MKAKKPVIQTPLVQHILGLSVLSLLGLAACTAPQITPISEAPAINSDAAASADLVPGSTGGTLVGSELVPGSTGGTLVGSELVPGSTGGTLVGSELVPGSNGGTLVGSELVPGSTGGTLVGSELVPGSTGGTLLGSDLVPGSNGGTLMGITAPPQAFAPPPLGFTAVSGQITAPPQAITAPPQAITAPPQAFTTLALASETLYFKLKSAKDNLFLPIQVRREAGPNGTIVHRFATYIPEDKLATDKFTFEVGQVGAEALRLEFNQSLANKTNLFVSANRLVEGSGKIFDLQALDQKPLVAASEASVAAEPSMPSGCTPEALLIRSPKLASVDGENYHVTWVSQAGRFKVQVNDETYDGLEETQLTFKAGAASQLVIQIRPAVLGCQNLPNSLGELRHTP